MRFIRIILPFIFVLAIFVWLDTGFHVFSGMNTGKLTAHKVQAVFLSNGQVYFGNLSRNGFDSWQLTNVHYLEKSQIPEEPAKGGSPTTQTKLVKLTQDLHQPEDAMYISDKNILFWQNLQNTSPITQTIASGK